MKKELLKLSETLSIEKEIGKLVDIERRMLQAQNEFYQILEEERRKHCKEQKEEYEKRWRSDENYL